MRKRRTTSLDLRERILDTYDAGEGPREDVARRFRVSLGMVKKLLQQRRHTGDIAAIAAALAQVTPKDALGWFVSCGFSFC